MKKLLLAALLGLNAGPAVAQTQLLVAGAALGLSALKKGPQKPDAFVTQQAYQGQYFSQKRTPANKQPGNQVAALEKFLDDRYTALIADENLEVTADKEHNFTIFRTVVANAHPNWNLVAYDAEWQFYRQVDSQRRRVLEARARRLQARTDSLTAIRYREHQEREARMADSLGRMASRQRRVADSLKRVAAVHSGSYTMYVNATTLNMRAEPSANAKLQVQLHGGARVTVDNAAIPPKHNIPGARATWISATFSHETYYTGNIDVWYGWVNKQYLVGSQDSVTVAVTNEEFTDPSPLVDARRYPTTVIISGNKSASFYSKKKGPRVPQSNHQYQRGPRGGCYYYNSSGKKEYVDRSLCN